MMHGTMSLKLKKRNYWGFCEANAVSDNAILVSVKCTCELAVCRSSTNRSMLSSYIFSESALLKLFTSCD